MVGWLGIAGWLGMAGAAEPDATAIRLLVPSAAGSNTDLVTRGLAERMTGHDGSRAVELQHVPGNGGLTGLASFLEEGNGAQMLVTSLNMVDAAMLKRVPVSIDRLTPIARFASEPYALAVPSESPFTSLDDLRTALLSEPSKLAWAGGPAGSADHVGTILLGRALGVELSVLNYVAFLGTSEAVGAAIDNKVAAIFVPIAEVTAGLEASKLRLLAIASDAPLPGRSERTLRDSGVDLVFGNWRSLVARPGMSAETRAGLIRQLAAAVQSPEWQALVLSKGWQPAFLAGDDFARFVLGEQARLEPILRMTGALRKEGE